MSLKLGEPIEIEKLKRIYRHMLTARLIDQYEQKLVAQNLAYFQLSGSGHEACAVLAEHLTPVDYLHIHYRDKALLLARGLPVIEFFRAHLAKATSNSGGRQMPSMFNAREHGVLSMVTPVGNHALQAVGVAAAIREKPGAPIVLCSIGDGSTQQGEFYEAIAEAVRNHLPVLFFIENNRYSISTPTRGKTFFDLPSGPSSAFFGLPIQSVDGTNVFELDRVCERVIHAMRQQRGPAIVVMQVERLCSHTNADDESRYRHPHELKTIQIQNDPLRHIEKQISDPAFLATMQVGIQQLVENAAESALREAEPTLCTTAKAPLSQALLARSEYTGEPEAKSLVMREALNQALAARLVSDKRVVLIGEDIEDPKGDVFGVTRGLSRRFPERVMNSALSESTIVGTCIGRALAGSVPSPSFSLPTFYRLLITKSFPNSATFTGAPRGNGNVPFCSSLPVAATSRA